MSNKVAKPSEMYVPAYQISPKPFVTSSAGTEVDKNGIQIVFPTVTRWVQVTNHSNAKMKVGFSLNGAISNPHSASYFIEEASAHLAYRGTSRLWEVRCKSVFIAKTKGGTGGKVSVAAGLTGIDDLKLTLSGSEGVM